MKYRIMDKKLDLPKFINTLKQEAECFFLEDKSTDGRFMYFFPHIFGKLRLEADSSQNVLRQIHSQSQLDCEIPAELSHIPTITRAFGLIHFEYAYQKSLQTQLTPYSGQVGEFLFSHEQIVYDKKLQVVYLISFNADERRLGQLERLVHQHQTGEDCAPESVETGVTDEPFFKSIIKKVKSQICEGNLFQCVVSELREASSTGHPFHFFKNLYGQTDAPFCFYLNSGSTVTFGASPERLIKVDAKGTVLSNPIAGTRARGRNEIEDKKQKRNLMRSPKERAEHLMLVDLARNDLGKVCAPGKVQVKAFMQPKAFKNIYHLISEVEGQLRADKNAVDAFDACFPAGTLSGAPKVEALKNIQTLEKGPRGIYGGCLVTFDIRGGLDSFLLIRSAQYTAGKLSYGVGAGVVYDSTPKGEYQEICTKAKTIENALALKGVC